MSGALKLEGKKNMSISNEIVDFSSPNKVYIPLINCGKECEAIVKKGDKVKKGEVIAIRRDIDFPIHSSVSGEVIGIKKRLYIDNNMVSCVVIDNNCKETLENKKLIKDITEYTKEEFINLLKNCGVTGMGGSDFPTFLKYKNNLKILIVNAVECEPYLTSDEMLVRLKAEQILETIDAIMKINNIDKCFIAYKKKNRDVLLSFLNCMDKYTNIYLAPLKDLYPMGWERKIIKDVLNVEYEKYPNEAEIVVNNVSTIYSIYKALKFQRPISKRIITISGEGFSDQINVLLKIGADISEVLKELGNYNSEEVSIIAGGPMMGIALSDDSTMATKNLNGITILPKSDGKLNNCISCGKCIDVCPSNLCPVLIMKNSGDLKKFHPEKCCECGLCSFVCPSKINVREYVKNAKKGVKK